MVLRRSKSAALACALVALSLLTGCENTREKNAGREGLVAEIGELGYNVYITRELNPKDVEDKGYYTGPEAKPGFALYGVFLTVCNEHSTKHLAASDFAIVDTQGNRFEPLPLPEENVFSYRPEELGKEQCIPEEGSAAASAPTNGSLLVFNLPLTTLENRPLDLEITAPVNPETGEAETGLVELDI
jgi:hypothetical protein